MNRMAEPESVVIATRCLEHQLPEDRPSPLGLICRECRTRLQRDPPSGPCFGYWESQPVLCDGDACSVFTLAWDNFRIRSLHPTTALDELERMALNTRNPSL